MNYIQYNISIFNHSIYLMKIKHLFCLLLLTAFASCNEKLSLENENEYENEASLTPVTRAPGDAQYDVLGFGYDITGDYLNPMSVRNLVIDIERYHRDRPGRVKIGTASSGSDKFFYGADSADYLEEITKDYTISVSGGYDNGNNSNNSNNENSKQLFSGSISTNHFLKSKGEYSSKYSFASRDVVRSIKRLWISEDAEYMTDYLTPEFLEDVNRLSPTRLVERYGTHVLTDITIGGRYRLLFRSIIDKTTNRTEIKSIVKAGAEASWKGINGKAEGAVTNETVTNLVNENRHKELFVTFYGGKGSCIKYDLEEGKPTSSDIAEWENTVSLNNANLTDVNWKETIPLYRFIKDPQKKEAVKKAIEDYIEEHSIKMIEVEPFYCYYSAKYVNHSYFTEWQGYHFNTDDYMGITCYLPSKNEPGAVPLYEYYSAKYVNHSYFTEYRGKHFNTDDYQGIAGYIFKEKKDGTVPLYAYYSAKYVNHSYFAEDKGRQFNTDERIGILGYVYPAD